MSISYLLDTSVLILSLRRDTHIRQRIADVAPVYMSTISLGELYHGAEGSIHITESIAEIDAMAVSIPTLAVDNTTAKIYGLVKHRQSQKGRMLPDNDLWIAATAIQYGFTLAARDHHFTWIAGLTLEQW